MEPSRVSRVSAPPRTHRNGRSCRSAKEVNWRLVNATPLISVNVSVKKATRRSAGTPGQNSRGGEDWPEVSSTLNRVAHPGTHVPAASMRRPVVSSTPADNHAGDSQGGEALLWGEPRLMRRGGNPPAPAFPERGNGKGAIPVPCCRRLLLLLFSTSRRRALLPFALFCGAGCGSRASWGSPSL